MTVEGHTDDTDGTDFLWLAENAESADFYGSQKIKNAKKYPNCIRIRNKFLILQLETTTKSTY